MTHPDHRPHRLLPFALAAVVIWGSGATTLQAQTDSVTVTPGEQYRAEGLHRWLLGNGYRDLWSRPLSVEVLDFPNEKGGLVPVERGGNVQTMALRFRAPDGTEYNFRSVDKELTGALPPYAQETLVDWIRQDVTSAQMPLAPVVATPLLEAVEVLNPGPRLVFLPDIPELGEFREEYGGMLGTFEQHPGEVEGAGGFAGSIEVKSTEGMLDDLEDDPVNRADARSFLTARFIDLLIGDWDRHEGQWRWARYDREGVQWWVPIPEDRDYAFVNYGGLLIQAARLAGIDRLIDFDEDYPTLQELMANSMELNRRLLAELPRPAWDSVAAFVHGRITDEVIADAVGHLPPEHRAGVGEKLARTLRGRRDRLPELADEYYELMAEMVDIHATDADEIARIRRHPDGMVDVAIETTQGLQVYSRRFDPSETKELRIDLHGGNDRAVVEGPGGDITIRVMGGGGDDVLEDRGSGPTALYDDRGENQLVGGRGTRVDPREYVAPEPVEVAGGLLPGPGGDWGTDISLVPTAGWRSHVGIVLGAQLSRTRYGFRQHPFSSRHTLTAVGSLEKGRGALEYRAELPGEGTDRWLELNGAATSMNAVRFHGFGNDTDAAEADSKVWLREISFGPLWHVPLGGSLEFVAGGTAIHTDPSYAASSPVALASPLGAESFGRVRAVASLLLDSRDSPWYPTRGLNAEVTAAVTPPVWDVDDPYSRIEGIAAAYLPLPVTEGLVLALRGGGARVWGGFPFQESAFLGGSQSLRGVQRERFAGDAMVFGNAELRVPIMEMELLMRGDLGISGLVDAGRVYVDGESPGGWHYGRGGSVWFATPAISASLTYAYGEDHRFYADIGLPF